MTVPGTGPVTAPPVVLIAEELAPSVLAVLGDEVEIRHVDGADRAALLPALADAAAVLVRSATRIDAEALAAAPNLKVVARAGVGLDNVDVGAATARGVMVVNAPTSNVVSAAEHAVALLLSAARRIPAADASLRAGRWDRSRFTGIELAGKTVGIVGLGRIGVLVAQRLAAFDVSLIAYDPYIQPGRAAHLGVRLVALDELLRESDLITVHLPKTPETVGLIGAAELATTKRGVILVNAARGGLVDEAALADALRSGQVGAAGIDVYTSEPCTDSPLFALPTAVVTPHLGASTTEAQDKAGAAVAHSVRLALQGEFVPDAVNVQAGGVVAEDVRPGLPLAEKLGRVFTAVAGGLAQSVTVDVRGQIAAFDVSVVPLAVLKGVFSDVVEEQVTYVNAPLFAEERGLEVDLTQRRGEPGLPQPDPRPRGDGRRHRGDRVRHAVRQEPGAEADRGRRLRHGPRPVRLPALLRLHRPARRRRHGGRGAGRGRHQHRRSAGQPHEPRGRGADGGDRRQSRARRPAGRASRPRSARARPGRRISRPLT